jgi:hypothetical protein
LIKKVEEDFNEYKAKTPNEALTDAKLEEIKKERLEYFF